MNDVHTNIVRISFNQQILIMLETLWFILLVS